MNTFDRIKDLAKKRHLSLVEVNDRAHLGKRSIYNWKTKSPSIDSLRAVAAVLHTSTDYLLGNTDDPNLSDDGQKPVVDLDHDQVYSYRGRHVPDKYLKMIKNLMDDDIDDDDDGEWLN